MVGNPAPLGQHWLRGAVMWWTAADLPPKVSLHRSALEAEAAAHRYVIDGKVIKFTDAEVPRFAFLWWLVHEAKRLDPRERIPKE